MRVERKIAMSFMITDGQKSYMQELIDQLQVDLADYTEKEANELTCREAADIIDDLKAERFARRYRKQ